MKITTADIRRHRYCVNGVIEWLKTQGIDWRDAVKNGIDSEILIQTGDAMAARLVKLVEAEHADGRR